MLNEGFITNDSKTLVKSEMIRQLHRLGPTTPDLWERAVFEALTSGRREDVDWDFEDNRKGVFLWIKTFDELIGELIEDGHVTEQEVEGGKTLVPTQTDVPIQYSHLVYPPRP